MKNILLLTLIISAVSCSTLRNPASDRDGASARVALGNVEASAHRLIENNQICFDIQLDMKNISKEDASWSNWIITAFDQNGKSYNLPVSDRTPASTEGGVIMSSQYYYEKYHNKLKTCLPYKNDFSISRLEISPKSFPYNVDSLNLQWNQ